MEDKHKHDMVEYFINASLARSTISRPAHVVIVYANSSLLYCSFSLHRELSIRPWGFNKRPHLTILSAQICDTASHPDANSENGH